MERREKVLQGIDISRSIGVEIGALCRPMVSKTDGHVLYVDHADTATLKQKYRDDPDVDVECIVDVDGIWGSNSLAEVIRQKVDYVIASHVVEHVPDLITWLRELRSILKPSGEVRLVVPDRRFTFDYLRYETRLVDVVYAEMMRARVPLPHLVLDYVANVVKMDGGKMWLGQVDKASLEHHHSLSHAINCAAQSREGIYHDIHCWVFTPRSFASLFAEMADHGLIDFECSSFHDTAPGTIEFFVGLRATEDMESAARSWRAIAEKCEDFV